MALISFTPLPGAQTKHLQGVIVKQTDKHLHLRNDHGPILVPMAFIHHITPTKEPA